MNQQQIQFLYLNTTGWKTGKQHMIEIWFVEHNSRYFIMAERKKKAHWIQNIMHNPKVSFSVRNKKFEGNAKIIEKDNNDNTNLELISKVSRLMYDKYNWNDGLIVELSAD